MKVIKYDEQWDYHKVIRNVIITDDFKMVASFYYNLSDYLYLQAVYIQEEFRGKGISNYIMDLVNVYFYEQTEYDVIYLQVHEDNIIAMNLYLKNGFTELEKEEEYITMYKQKIKITNKH